PVNLRLPPLPATSARPSQRHGPATGDGPARRAGLPQRGIGYRTRQNPVGFQNSATRLDLGFYAARSYSLRRPSRTAPGLIRSRVGPGRVELAAAMGSSSVVVGFVLGEDQPQMWFTEDQHPVGHLRPGGEHEPFGIGVARGLRGRIFTASMPALARTAS